MERELRNKVLKLTVIVFGYMLSFIFLLGALVYLFIHLWLPGLLLLSLALLLFFGVAYLNLGTSLYIIYDSSAIYVPRLYRHAKKEILNIEDVKKVQEIQGMFKDGFYVYTPQGYYYLKRKVFNEIREYLPENVEFHSL